MISHRNLQVNFEQLMRSFFADVRRRCPPDLTIVSWLPFYHDMGLVLGVCAPDPGRLSRRADQPGRRSWRARPGGCGRWRRIRTRSRRRPTSPSTWPPARPATAISPGSTSAGCWASSTAPNGSSRRRLDRFADRFAHFNFRDHMLRPSYGLAEATVFVATGTWSESSGAVHFDVDELAAGRARRCAAGSRHGAGEIRTAAVAPGADRRRRHPPGSARRTWSARSGCTATTSPTGYWGRPPEEQQCFGATLVDPSPGTPDGPWLRTGDLGFSLRWRAVHRRPHQGPADHPRSQSLSRGHRGDGPGDHSRSGRGDLGAGEQHREAGHRHRAQEAGRFGGRRRAGSATSRATSPPRYPMRTA